MWEGGDWCGCVLFGRGNSRCLGNAFGVSGTEVAELVRVALREHTCPTSRIVAIAVKMLRRASPGLRVLVSYADIDQSHFGTIYQAAGWFYVGWTKGGDRYRDASGREWHSRMLSPTGRKKVYGKYRDVPKPQDLVRITTAGRHKYVMPLDAEMRKRLEPMRKPYPKRATSDTGDTPAVQAGKGGSTPTVALTEAERVN